MFIDKKEADRRLNSPKNLLNRLQGAAAPCVKHEPMKKYTPPADKSVKILAGVLVGQGERPADVQKMLNLTPSQVRSGTELPETKHTIERVRDLALDKMLIAMGLMTQDKFESASLKDLAAVTGSLSRVIEKTTPREYGPNVQFIVHAPAQKSLGQYLTIDV